jgi:hypothetical protein
MNKNEHRDCVLFLVLLMAFAGCSNDTNVLTLTKEPPSIETFSPAVVTYGDTILMTGSGFNAIPASNRIVISPNRFSDPSARRVIVPFGGSRTELRGVVPDGSFAGSIRVEDAEPLGSAFSFGVQPPGGASSPLPFSARLLSGNVGKAFFSGNSYRFSITAGASDEDYLVMLFSDAIVPDDATSSLLYNITAQSQTALAAEAVSIASQPNRNTAAAAGSVSLPDMSFGSMGTREREFKRRVNEEMLELLRKAESGQRTVDRAGQAFRSSISGEGPPPQTAYFKMLKGTAPDSITVPANFTTVEADLKFNGAHTLLYVDTETPSAYLSDEEAKNLGQVFDSEFYGTDRNAFGSESDINGDDRVAILLSPAVNKLTPPGEAQAQGGFIAGYFLWNDLLPHLVDSGVTNGMEIFYGVVPDPDGFFGNVFPREKTLPVIEGVLAHEFCHMIIFNYRVIIYGQSRYEDYVEKEWLEEGLAHIAEDLNGLDSSNIKRANLFLARPGDVSLIYGADALDKRGADFLFLRHLGDRFGEGIFKTLVQSRKSGAANVEAATRGYFKELFADWSAACYLSGRGITDDTRFNYSSIDLQSNFNQLFVIPGNVSGQQMMGSINSMAPEYISFAIPSAATVDFTIGSDPAGRLNAVVIRLR